MGDLAIGAQFAARLTVWPPCVRQHTHPLKQDIFTGDRDNAKMPDLSGLFDLRGKPVGKHNRSCHVCTQGNASWRGGFFQPIGCSRCPMIFCPRCLGHIMADTVHDTHQEGCSGAYGSEQHPGSGKDFIDQFIDTQQMSYVCICCQNKCACQHSLFSAVAITSSSGTKQGSVFKTSSLVSFAVGDKVRVSGHSGTSADELLKKAEWPVKAVTLDRKSFTLDIDFKGKGGKGGTVEMIKLQKHKKWGWVGATGSGVEGGRHGASKDILTAVTPSVPKAKPASKRLTPASRPDAARKRTKASARRPSPPSDSEENVSDSKEYEPEQIIGKRLIKGAAQYFVKWVGYDTGHSTWEPMAHLTGCGALIEAYERKLAVSV